MRLLLEEERDEVIEPEGEQRDREVTLGSWTLTGVFLVLAMVCGLCFGLGYALGRHSQPATTATQATQNSPQTDSSNTKPSASTQGVASAAAAPETQAPEASADDHADTDEPAVAAAPPPAKPVAMPVARPVAQPVAKPVAKPAIPPAVAPAKAPASKAQSAFFQALAGPLMVQIAVLSHPEDADVLVGALHKRGYSAQAHRDAGDGLIHVRLGPFQDRAEAEQWRQKLLNDGYNAMVQP